MTNNSIISSVDDLMKAVKSAQEKFSYTGTEKCWWRGQSQDSWDLIPKVYRPPGYNESGLAWKFLNRAKVRHPHFPAAEDWPAWLFLMQHYGLPTRLLDWSESPLVGLYFAINDNRFDNESVLYGLFIQRF